MNDSPVASTPNGKKSKKLIILSMVLVITLIATGVLSYLYMLQKDETASLQKELDTKSASNIEKTTSSDSSVIKDSGETTYTAKVGKFTLKMPSSYTVVQKLDGGGEGGEATVLNLAKKVNGDSNVVDLNYLISFELSAITNLNNESIDSFVNTQATNSPDQPTEKTSVKIDGVQARVFDFAGIDVIKKVFFTKNNVLYTVTFDDNERGNKEFTDFVAGFKFN